MQTIEGDAGNNMSVKRDNSKLAGFQEDKTKTTMSRGESSRTVETKQWTQLTSQGVDNGKCGH